MSSDVLTIEGFDGEGFVPSAGSSGSRCRNASGQFTLCGVGMSYGNIIPPDIGGFGLMSNVRQFIPSVGELRQSSMAGGAAAGGILLGLGLERFVGNNLSMIPSGAYPLLHVGIGAIGGKLLTSFNPALGVGFAAGMASLGFIRFLQTWLKMDIDISGAFAGADLSSLNDLMDADDLLPPELQDIGNVVIEEDMAGYGTVAVEEMGWAHL
jgi:hypothetical protein